MVNLRLEDGNSQTAGQTGTTPEASTCNLGGVAAVQSLVVQAGTTGTVNVSLTGTGSLDVSSVTTYAGDISLTAGSGGSITGGTITTGQGNVTLTAVGGSITSGTITTAQGNVTLTSGGSITSGTITAQSGDASLTASGGSIVDGTSGTQTNVTAKNVTLSRASGGIGTASDPFRIDASHNGTGVVTATAAQDIDLDQTAGTLNLGLVASTTGNVALTSAGAITDGGTGDGGRAGGRRRDPRGGRGDRHLLRADRGPDHRARRRTRARPGSGSSTRAV